MKKKLQTWFSKTILKSSVVKTIDQKIRGRLPGFSSKWIRDYFSQSGALAADNIRGQKIAVLVGLMHLFFLATVAPIWLIFYVSLVFCIRLISLQLGKDLPGWPTFLLNIFILMLIAVALSDSPPVITRIGMLNLFVMGLSVGRKFNYRRLMTLIFCCIVSVTILVANTTNFIAIFLMVLDCLFIGYAFLAVHQPIEAGEAVRKLAGSTFKTLLIILPVSITAYFAFPRVNQFSNRLQDSTQFTSGFNEALDPGSLAQIALSRRIAFRAQLDQSVKIPDLYWRGEVLWNSQGLAWSKSSPTPKLDQAGLRSRRDPSYLESIKSQLTTQTVVLESRYNDWMFILDTPFSASKLNPSSLERIYQSPGYVFKRLGADMGPGSYAAKSLQSGHKEASDPDPIYLQTPENIEAPLRVWLNKLPKTITNPSKKVEWIKRYLRQRDFRYTLRPGKTKNLTDFWLTKKRGFCEHFAGSIATLLRFWQVPTRVVLGFHGGQWNRFTKTWTVRDMHAHAWMEYFDQGWKRFDPTSVVAPERLNEGMDGWLSGSGTRSKIFAWLLSAQEAVENSFSFFKKSWLEFRYWIDGFFSADNLERVLGFFLKAILAPLVFLIIGLWFIFYLRRLRKANDYADRIFQEFETKMESRNLIRGMNEGQLAFIQRCKEGYSDLETMTLLDSFVSQYSVLKYRDQNLPDEIQKLKVDLKSTWKRLLPKLGQKKRKTKDGF